MSKKIIDFNHISKSLTEDQMLELKSYYTTYHRKLWIFKRAYKRYKRFKYLGNSLSIIFSVGGIGGAIGSGGISLVVISTLALLIQGWMKHKNLNSIRIALLGCVSIPIKAMSIYYMTSVAR